jgi:hypothetical protein
MVFETKNTCKVALYARKNFVPRYGHIYIFSWFIRVLSAHCYANFALKLLKLKNYELNSTINTGWDNME